MADDTDADTLKLQRMDYVASAAKAALGAVPFVGSLLVELAGVVIPDQRADRLAKYAVILHQKLDRLEQEFVRAQLANENFTDLMEEGLRQAARSVSDERREYIESLMATSLSEDDIAFQESRHLLRILGEINDIEVLWLRFYREPTFGGDDQFRQQHMAVFEPVPAALGSPQPVVDKATLRQSYKEHLVQLGLLERRHRVDQRTNLPEFDRHGAIKVQGYSLTPLGRLLLQHIGLGDANNDHE